MYLLERDGGIFKGRPSSVGWMIQTRPGSSFKHGLAALAQSETDSCRRRDNRFLIALTQMGGSAQLQLDFAGAFHAGIGAVERPIRIGRSRPYRRKNHPTND